MVTPTRHHPKGHHSHTPKGVKKHTHPKQHTAPKSSGGYHPSHTATKTQHKKKYEDEGDAEHSLLTRSIKIHLADPPKGKTLTEWEYHETQNNFADGGAGYQSVNRLFAWLTTSQINTSTGLGYNGDQGFQSLAGMNLNQFNTGGNLTIISGAAGQTPYTDRFLVRSINATVNLTNRLNISTYCTLYLIRYKRDTNTASITHWSNGMKDMAAAQGAATMGGANSPLFQANGGTDGTGHVGCLPQQAREFKDFCKVIDKQTFILPGGGSERINYHITLNKTIKHEIALLQGTTFLAGYTLELFLVANSVVVLDKAAGRPTYGTTSVIAVCETKYNCAVITGPKNRIKLEYGVVNIPHDTLGSNQVIINDVDAQDIVKQAV